MLHRVGISSRAWLAYCRKSLGTKWRSSSSRSAPDRASRKFVASQRSSINADVVAGRFSAKLKWIERVSNICSSAADWTRSFSGRIGEAAVWLAGIESRVDNLLSHTLTKIWNSVANLITYTIQLPFVLRTSSQNYTDWLRNGSKFRLDHISSFPNLSQMNFEIFLNRFTICVSG